MSAIIKIKDLYFLWSDVVDAPISNGMTEQQTRKVVVDRAGERARERAVRELDAQIERADKTGTSHRVRSLEDLLAGNRAGKGEKKLTADEIYEQYIIYENKTPTAD